MWPSFRRGMKWAAERLYTDEVVTEVLAGQMFGFWSSKVQTHCGKRQQETDLRQEVTQQSLSFAIPRLRHERNGRNCDMTRQST